MPEKKASGSAKASSVQSAPSTTTSGPAGYIPLALIITFFVSFQLYVLRQGSFLVHGDNALYMYMARQLSMGIIPYRDFFFAHPPLMIAPTALFIRLFGTSFTVGMIQPILAGIVSIILLYLIGEKIQPGTGIYAAALLAAAQHFLFYSHWLGGISLSIAFLLLSFYLTLQGRHKLSGACLVLSFLTRISHFPILLPFFAYNYLKKNRGFFTGFALASLASSSLLLIPGFLNSAVLYHFSKGTGPISVGYGAFLFFAKSQFIPILLSIIAAAYIFRCELKHRLNLEPLLFAYAASKSCLILFLLSEVRLWYLVYVIPFICLPAGFLMGDISKIKINKKRIAAPLAAAFLFLLLISAYPAYSSTKFSEKRTYDPVYDFLEINEGDYLLDTLSGMGHYLAIKNGASISGNMVDMNPLRFANGLIDIDDAIARISSQPPKYIFDMRGGTAEEISWDHYWRFTPLRAYIYSNYRPHYLVYNDKFFAITLIWEPQSAETIPPETIPEFEPQQAVYQTEFLTRHELVGDKVDVQYTEKNRLSATTDLELDAFLDTFTALTHNKKQLMARNAWDFSQPHHTVQDGILRSETWLTPHNSRFLIFTETTKQDQAGNPITVSLAVMDLDPTAGYWNSFTIYENIMGGLVPVYEETLTATIES